MSFAIRAVPAKNRSTRSADDGPDWWRECEPTDEIALRRSQTNYAVVTVERRPVVPRETAVFPFGPAELNAVFLFEATVRP